MKKIISILILMNTLIHAATSSAEYDVDFSVAGTIAKASIEKVQEGDFDRESPGGRQLYDNTAGACGRHCGQDDAKQA